MNLRQNSLSDKSATAIARALHINNTITTLHLSQNRLTQMGIDVLNEMLEKNTTVKYLVSENGTLDGMTCWIMSCHFITSCIIIHGTCLFFRVG